jgi:WD40 repeat protein
MRQVVWKRSSEKDSLDKEQRTIKYLIMVTLCVMMISCTPSTEIAPIHNATMVQTLSTEDQNGIITSVDFSLDGRFIAAGTTVGKVRVWKTSDGTLLHSLKAYMCCRIYDVAFSPDSNFLVTGIPTDRVLVWNVSDGTLARTLKGGSFFGSMARNMTSVAYSPDGKTIAGGAYDGSIILWRVKDGTRQNLFMGSWASSSIFDLAYSPDGKILALGKENNILLFQVSDGELANTIRGSRGAIMSVVFDPSGNLLAAGGTEGNTRLIDVRHGSILHTFSTKRGNVIWSLAFSPDGRTLAVGSRDGNVRIWDVNNKTLLYRIEVMEGEVNVAFSPDGKTLAVGIADGTVQLWSIPLDN